MEINETRIRYLEAIQRVVDRLSNISFILKGWAVSLVAGLMALAASGSNQGFVLIAYIPIAVFWFLDAYFLMMERQYRDLFKENIDLSKKLEQFTLKRGKGNIGTVAFVVIAVQHIQDGVCITVTVVGWILRHMAFQGIDILIHPRYLLP